MIVRNYALPLLLSIIGSICSVHATDVYKSIDAEGHVVYSDRASPAAQKTSVHADPPHAAEAERIAKEQALLRADEAQRNQERATADHRQTEDDKQRTARCTYARDMYYQVKDARRLYRHDEAGNLIYYSDKEADARKEDARQIMQAACDP
jgi:flagellar biosynthesis GTPase FlhF